MTQHATSAQTQAACPPDAVAVWQSFAEGLADVQSQGPRGVVRIGVVDTLSVCDALPFWYNLFVELGFSVVMPPHRPAGLNDLAAQGRETVPSESVCYPAKMSHIRAAAVIGKGANAVFMPMYDRYARCSVSCEYANAVGKCMPQILGEPGRVWRGTLPANLPSGQAVFVSPLLLLRKPWKMVDYPSEVFQLLVCLNALLPDEHEISVEELALALAVSAQAQADFQSAVDEENERALAWAHEPGHHGILLVGRPYHWDRSLLHDLNTIVTEQGLSVLTSHPDLDRRKASAAGGRKFDAQGSQNDQDARNARDARDARTSLPLGREGAEDKRQFGGEPWGRTYSEEVEAELIARTASDRARRTLAPEAMPRAALDFEPMPNVGDRAQAVPFWRSAKHMGRLCRAVAGDPDLDVVCLQSFGCAYDAASVPEAREIMRDANKPFTLLMIDDSVNTSHLAIRVRTLAAAIRQRKAASRRVLAQGDATIGSLSIGEQLERAQHAADAGILAGGQRTSLHDTLKGGTYTARMREDGTEIKPWERNFRSRGEAFDSEGAARRLRAVPLSDDIVQAALSGSVFAYADLGAEDYEAARLCCENYCFIVTVLTGRVLRICASIPRRLARLLVPYVCDKCLIDALPRTVERALGWAPTIIWERNAPVDMAKLMGLGRPATPDSPACFGAQASADAFDPRAVEDSSLASPVAQTASGGPAHSATTKSQVDAKPPLVGIVGTPPLVFDARLNDNLVKTILDEGCQPVLPWLDLMLVDDISYIDQLEEFAAQGVSHVVYLISFGCLKGHTQVRPRLAEWRERFPKMPITVIDFDGDASSLNRRNRLYLALATAKESRR